NGFRALRSGPTPRRGSVSARSWLLFQHPQALHAAARLLLLGADLLVGQSRCHRAEAIDGSVEPASGGLRLARPARGLPVALVLVGVAADSASSLPDSQPGVCECAQ